MPVTVMPRPECRAGKHTNCVEWAFNSRDQEVPCPCQQRGHKPEEATK